MNNPPPIETMPEQTLPTPSAPHKKKPPMLIASVVVMGIIIVTLLVALLTVPATPTALPTPTSTPPTPTVVRRVSAIATTSAFTTWGEHIASIAAILQGFSLTDETLTAPMLDVDLEL